MKVTHRRRHAPGKRNYFGILGATGALIIGALGVGLPSATAGEPAALLGHSNLGGQGANAAVSVVGNTAIVGAGFLPSAANHASFYNPQNCPTVSVKVVDISNPASPAVRSTIPVAVGQSALDVYALHVTTPSFTGDLAAVALQTCSAAGNGAHRGISYYNVNNPSQPVLLGRYLPGTANPAGCSPLTPVNCASSQHDVSLVQRGDGRVLSLSTEPFANPDLKIVDVTNPAAPVQVATLNSGSPVFTSNGCRPFGAAHSAHASHDGTQALLAAFDAGAFTVDIANPATPTLAGHWSYPNNRQVEGNAGYADYAQTTRPLGVLAEEDWVGVSSSLTVRIPQIAGVKPACEAMFTLFDPQDNSAVFRKPNLSVNADMAYLGRGCPQSAGSTGPDPYLSNPAGKIALIDRNPVPAYQPSLPSNFCSFADRVRRAEQAGAIGAVFANTAATPAFSLDGDHNGVSIPAYMIETADGNALRPFLCPSVVSGQCSPHPPIIQSMVDRRGIWGGLKILDLTNPAAPVEVGSYQTPRSRSFPPPDLGVYSASRLTTDQNLVYAAWNSDGLRVVDLSASPVTETASFVPPDTPDPTGTIPAKAYVQGVDLAGCGRAVISDVNSGLYVLSVPAPSECSD